MRPLPQKKRFQYHSVNLAIVLLAAMAGDSSATARAQATSVGGATPLTLSLPAQPLSQALNALARQAKLQMTFPAGLVAGRTAPAISGQMTVKQALERLLEGTGLTASLTAEAIAVVPSSPPATRSDRRLPMEEVTQAVVRVTATAEQALRQAPGVSTITAQDIEKSPPANDLSDLIRTMPGVNLVGNSASGQYGNSRQIDLRGMGPENTLILIDGVPVNARNSTRMGRSGERNTRGDTNWVPVEAVETIEVLRGPAAARYGSGASGGVVNIITKRPTEQLAGSVTYYANRPQHDEEQSTNRIGFQLAGPISEQLSFRLYGSGNKTDADELGINQDYSTGATPPAGREGVRNRDANLLLRWELSPQQVLEWNTGFSRQGNIYAGDRAQNSSYQGLSELAQEGAETNTKYRRTASVVHKGKWGDGRTSRLGLAYEGTADRRLREGLTGGSEGAFVRDATSSQASALDTSTSELRNWTLSGEFNTPLRLGLEQILTLGFEAKNEQLDDPYSMSNANVSAGAVAGRSSQAQASNWSAFIESNIVATDDLMITPGVRYDRHSQFGDHWSPSLNGSYQWTREVSFKAGVARAFKAPNLYQSNPNYLWETNGNGCPVNWPRPNNSGCVILGNAGLMPETSINKEIGAAYDANGYAAGLTYFRNDYDGKIVADMPSQIPELLADNRYLFRWTNADKAVVRGLEGHLTIPILGRNGDRLKWMNNLTYMVENRNRSTLQPLATVPKYTVNSSLDWQATDKLSVVVTATFYGKQEPRTQATNGSAAAGHELNARGAYNLVGASIGYTFHSKLKGRVGVSNVFDKRLFREHNQSGAGAASYNEAGRAIYASLTASF